MARVILKRRDSGAAENGAEDVLGFLNTAIKDQQTTLMERSWQAFYSFCYPDENCGPTADSAACPSGRSGGGGGDGDGGIKRMERGLNEC